MNERTERSILQAKQTLMNTDYANWLIPLLLTLPLATIASDMVLLRIVGFIWGYVAFFYLFWLHSDRLGD